MHACLASARVLTTDQAVVISIVGGSGYSALGADDVCVTMIPVWRYAYCENEIIVFYKFYSDGDLGLERWRRMLFSHSTRLSLQRIIAQNGTGHLTFLSADECIAVVGNFMTTSGLNDLNDLPILSLYGFVGISRFSTQRLKCVAEYSVKSLHIQI